MEIKIIKCDNCFKEIYSKIDKEEDNFFTLYRLEGEFTKDNSTNSFSYHFCSFPCFCAKFSSYFTTSPVKKDLVEILNKIAQENHLEFRFLKKDKLK